MNEHWLTMSDFAQQTMDVIEGEDSSVNDHQRRRRSVLPVTRVRVRVRVRRRWKRRNRDEDGACG